MEKMKNKCKRILVNWKYCVHFSFKWTGIVFSVLGAVGLIVPLNELLDEKLSLFLRIILAGLILLSVWLVTFIIGAKVALCKTKAKLFSIGNGHHLYVQFGDIFEIARQKKSRKNIVVPVNRCFDTIVDDDLISFNTLHGTAMNYLYESKKYTQEILNTKIQEKLKESHYEIVEQSEKPKGNLKRYDVGTVAEIEGADKENYFFLALSTFDKNLHANTTREEHTNALTRILQVCQIRSQGYPVYVPLIGGGLSMTGREEKDILEYMISMIKMERHFFNSDIYIIVRESAMDTIPLVK